MYDEIHELRPREGKQREFLIIDYDFPEFVRINGVYNSGWDFPTEYEKIC